LVPLDFQRFDSLLQREKMRESILGDDCGFRGDGLREWDNV
jgi:hypothetical protein